MINEEKFKKTYKNFDREIVFEIIDIFLNEYDDRIKKLKDFLSSGNLEELSKSAHAFKGVISNFETECTAYDEIAAIENLTRNYFTRKDHADDDGRKLQKNLEEILASFSKNSRQMYHQLKRMREDYAD